MAPILYIYCIYVCRFIGSTRVPHLACKSAGIQHRAAWNVDFASGNYICFIDVSVHDIYIQPAARWHGTVHRRLQAIRRSTHTAGACMRAREPVIDDDGYLSSQRYTPYRSRWSVHRYASQYGKRSWLLGCTFALRMIERMGTWPCTWHVTRVHALTRSTSILSAPHDAYVRIETCITNNMLKFCSIGGERKAQARSSSFHIHKGQIGGMFTRVLCLETIAKQFLPKFSFSKSNVM